MAEKKIINDRQRARKIYGFIQRVPDKVSVATTAAESDAAVLKLDWKESVRFASVSDITLPRPALNLLDAIDGTALLDGDRILLKDQSTSSENGIYVVNVAGLSWDRATDAIPGDTLTCGATTYVESGTQNGGSKWLLSTTGVTLGGPQVWSAQASSVPGSDMQVIFNDGGDLGASANLSFNKTSNVFAVTGSIGVQGQIVPSLDSTYNLGSETKRWANVYTGDLHLRNEKGDWTLIEDEDTILLRNNKTDKYFKFVIEPLDPPADNT
jgi:hypothetical protein